MAIKVKTSKKMAEVLSNELGLTIHQERLNSRQYFLNAGGLGSSLDFDDKTGFYNVLVVDYPVDFYAVPKIITTYELLKWLRNSKHNYNAFIQTCKDEIYI